MKHKMERMQSKFHQLRNMKLIEFIYNVLMINDIYFNMGLKIYHMVIKC